MKELLEEIIKDFSLEKFQNFFSNKNYDFKPYFEDVSYFIDDSTRFEEAKKIGEITTDKLELVFLGIKTKGNITERSSKKVQYDFAKKVLKTIDLERFHAGIFIFYDKEGNFRFSLVYQIPKGKRRKWSMFKRHTYYVAKDKPYRTFLKALVEAEFHDLDSIIKAFSIEPLTKEFYTKIQDWYAWALKESWFPGGRIEENLIRLITRLIFVWFLKEKGLIPKEIFEKEFLKSVVKDFEKKDYYYNSILQNLFFATLNREFKDRKFAELSKSKDKYLKHRKEFGVKTLYRYQDKLLISRKDFIDIFKNTPFINGGLFECLDDDSKYIDGFSRENKRRAKLPDYLFFSQEREEDLSHFYGKKKQKKVRGLINILKNYSFTADESSPIDVEVSLDPELLGNIFENLLAAYNPETQTTARKATGSYYTPKEIVEFMVDESLFYYFKTKTSIEDDKLKRLLSYNDEVLDFDEEEINSIVKAIDELKVIDPAVGSGAFPMGILQKLVYILGKIDPTNQLWRERQYKRALKEIEDILKIKDKEERERQLKEVNNNFDDSINYPDYARKLYLIENSIYGVDIQPIAIQICKLRFFLSLLIDQKVDEKRENFGIRPLPHLETKFVSANTLISIDKLSIDKPNASILELDGKSIFENEEITKLKNELKLLYKSHFSIKNRQEKLRLKRKAQKIKEELKKLLIRKEWKTKEAEKLVEFDVFDQTATADWFDPEWMFGVSDGFDIVIGNPPYVQLQKNRGELANLYKDKEYKTYNRKGDVYCLFYEKGIKLLKENGILCYISSNKWMRAGYGEKLREFFSKQNPLVLVNLGPNVFESATVDTNILLIQKATNQNKLLATTISENQKDNINIAEYLKQNAVTLTKLTKDAWFIGSKAEQQLKEKIERIGKPLKEWNVNIYYGIKTGLNEAFIITTEKRNEILANCKDEDERKRTEAIIKPILRGKDIKRYYYEWAGLWVIGIFPALHLNIDDYPALKKYFLDHFDIRQLEQSGKRYPELGFNARKKTGNKWFETQDQIAYYLEFEKDKVVWAETDQALNTVIAPKGMYLQKTCFMIITDNPKIINGFLNSNLSQWYIRIKCSNLGEKGMSLTKESVREIPFPPITPTNEPVVRQIEVLVDKILAAKRQNKNADTSPWEREIDRLVYKLYDLTEDEIKIITKE
ncbi:MAG: type II restriction endonuclease [Patescibacteria group bacterium]|nr:MAG: type II restriction endonuclease [Patescibacteria group bacterium]